MSRDTSDEDDDDPKLQTRGRAKKHKKDFAAQLFPMMGVFGILYGDHIRNLTEAHPLLRSLITNGFMGYGVYIAANQILEKGLVPTIYFRQGDELYQDLCRFVLQKKSSKFGVTWPFNHNKQLVQSTNYRRAKITHDIWWPPGYEDPKDVYYEKYGTQFFVHNGTLFMLQIHARHRRASLPKASGQAYLRALSRNDKPIRALLQEVWNTRYDDNGGKRTSIYTASGRYARCIWRRTVQKPLRRLDTVNINQGDREKLLKDAENYLKDSTKSWYARRGIPYRRGYLFYGPPGTGKSSLSTALAGHFQLDVYQLSLSTMEIDDQGLIELFSQLPSQCILLLEDIDSAGLSRREGNGPLNLRSEKSKVTLSGLLNALDGAAAPEGYILIMSTNHPEKLDPALVRAGRIDYDFEFKLADKIMIEEMFVRLMRDDSWQDKINEDLATKAELFASRIPEGVLPPATIQGYLLEHMDKIDIALDGVEQWARAAVQEEAAKQAAREAMAAEAELDRDDDAHAEKTMEEEKIETLEAEPMRREDSMRRKRKRDPVNPTSKKLRSRR